MDSSLHAATRGTSSSEDESVREGECSSSKAAVPESKATGDISMEVESCDLTFATACLVAVLSAKTLVVGTGMVTRGERGIDRMGRGGGVLSGLSEAADSCDSSSGLGWAVNRVKRGRKLIGIAYHIGATD